MDCQEFMNRFILYICILPYVYLSHVAMSVLNLTPFHSSLIVARVSSRACSLVALTLTRERRSMYLDRSKRRTCRTESFKSSPSCHASSVVTFLSDDPEFGVMSNPMTALIWFQWR